MFCIDSNSAASSLQGTFAQNFFQSMDPSHVAPHRLAFMRIVRLLEKAVFQEYNRIMNDNALQYTSNFCSTNSDFFTNKERRESYGCLVANMLSQRHVLTVSLLAFVSQN